MRYTILFGVLIFLILGCNKDKYTVAPQLVYKSANSTTVSLSQLLQMTLSFTDADGDVDSLYIKQVTPNCPQDSLNPIDNFRAIPSNFPSVKNQHGDIVVTFAIGASSSQDIPTLRIPQCGHNDSTYFRFFIQDKAKHRSDTINSEPIVILN